MHYKIPYITCFIDKYTVPINHDIDLDSIKIYKRNKDRTLGEMVYNFKVDCNSTPAIIFVEDSFGQEYFLKYSYLTKYTSFNKIKLITVDGYAVLRYKDYIREGHRIDYDDWIDLLKYLGYEVEYKEISDKQMEELL
jgi:hypothetical protein